MAKFTIPFTEKEVNITIPVITKFNNARKRAKNLKRRYDQTKETIIQKRQELQNTLEAYGRLKANVYDKTIRSFVTYINRIKDYDVSLKTTRIEGKVVNLSFKEFNSIKFDNIDLLIATLAGGGSGAITAAVTYAGIGVFASASTGTAISVLHGAAATNATLAWLGGGSLAAGGLGMVGGTAVLGGLVAIPALVFGGFYMNRKVDEAIEKLEKDEIKINKFIKEWKIAINRMDEIKSRTEKMQKTLSQLDLKFSPMINELRYLIKYYYEKEILLRVYDTIREYFHKVLKRNSVDTEIKSKISYSKFSSKDKVRLERILRTAFIIKRISDVKLINQSGLVSEESENMLKEAQKHLLLLG